MCRTFKRFRPPHPSSMPLRYALTLLGLFVVGCAAEPPGPLVGTWHSVPADSALATLERQYTFSADGTLAIELGRPEPLADTAFAATYTIEHDTLLTLADERGSEQFIAHVRGDTLVLRDAEGYSSLLLRLPD